MTGLLAQQRAHSTDADSVLTGLITQTPLIIIDSPGTSIYSEGSITDKIYMVAYGCILLWNATPVGTRHVSGFVLPGEVFGWESEETHQHSAETVTPSGLRVITTDQNQQHERLYVDQFVPTLVHLQEQLIIISRPTAEARVAAFLVNLCERQHSEHRLSLPMHRVDIAEYLGLSPETVSRVLSRFRAMHLIEITDLHTLEIPNIAELSEIFDE